MLGLKFETETSRAVIAKGNLQQNELAHPKSTMSLAGKNLF
tara:strand:+ start:5561 stop:5683 length:123 start_codon:yes stop_codon:yes gene_type:complete